MIIKNREGNSLPTGGNSLPTGGNSYGALFPSVCRGLTGNKRTLLKTAFSSGKLYFHAGNVERHILDHVGKPYCTCVFLEGVFDHHISPKHAKRGMHFFTYSDA
mgnify:CR=1 FL=1